MRGPGEIQASFIMESILEHVAAELGKSAHEVREVNIFKDLADRERCAADPTSPEIEKYSSQVALGTDVKGGTYRNWPMLGIWEQLKASADYLGRERAVAEFNAAQRWRKRGLAMTPVRYHIVPSNPEGHLFTVFIQDQARKQVWEDCWGTIVDAGGAGTDEESLEVRRRVMDEMGCYDPRVRWGPKLFE